MLEFQVLAHISPQNGTETVVSSIVMAPAWSKCLDFLKFYGDSCSRIRLPWTVTLFIISKSQECVNSDFILQ